MALSVLHSQLVETQVEGHTPSIGAYPIAAQMRAPFRGRIVKVGCVTGGIITTSSAVMTLAVNGTNVTGGTFSVTLAGAAAGQHFSLSPVDSPASAATAALGAVQEDDVITLTPSNASGANISATCYAVIKKMG